MGIDGRTYSSYASELAKRALSSLLSPKSRPSDYREAMSALGGYLGEMLSREIPAAASPLVVSTAEDADFLTFGLLSALEQTHPGKVRTAVFWNNHYQIPGSSVAPIVHEYIQPGFEAADSLVIVKSVISGSCVVRTNILALIEKMEAEKIYIVSPVMHAKSEQSLRSEFPADIAAKFKFIYFATDAMKNSNGEVLPGIGGQVYQLLGLTDQPARTGFMPELVKRLVAI